MLTGRELLEPLARARTDEVVITSMSVVRPWGRLSDSDLDFASADSAMGHTADLALGVALAQPSRRVVCLNGDGSMLMSLGTLATIVDSGADNLILFVIANETYEITGNQPIPGANVIDFAAIARAVGFPCVHHFEDPGVYASALDAVLHDRGPTFVSVAVAPGSEGPISRSAAEDARYLQSSLFDWSRTFRDALTKESHAID
jgi:thiamine pyrophosphate-dependent acetolactate synthase large subunit-like protein